MKSDRMPWVFRDTLVTNTLKIGYILIVASCAFPSYEARAAMAKSISKRVSLESCSLAVPKFYASFYVDLYQNVSLQQDKNFATSHCSQ